MDCTGTRALSRTMRSKVKRRLLNGSIFLVSRGKIANDIRRASAKKPLHTVPALEADLGGREALVPGPRPNLHQSRRCCQLRDLNDASSSPSNGVPDRQPARLPSKMRHLPSAAGSA